MRIEGAGRVLPAGTPRAPSADGFEGALRKAGEELQFSRHAQKRVERRALELSQPQVDRLQNAIGKAASKGARSSVVMLDDLAVVVDVRARMVVTAMNQNGQEGRVFTNIDSVVIA